MGRSTQWKRACKGDRRPNSRKPASNATPVTFHLSSGKSNPGRCSLSWAGGRRRNPPITAKSTARRGPHTRNISTTSSGHNNSTALISSSFILEQDAAEAWQGTMPPPHLPCGAQPYSNGLPFASVAISAHHVHSLRCGSPIRLAERRARVVLSQRWRRALPRRGIKSLGTGGHPPGGQNDRDRARARNPRARGVLPPGRGGSCHPLQGGHLH